LKKVNFQFSKRNFHSINAFTLVELLIVTALIGFLASISIPSSLKWVYQINQDSYLNELASFFRLIRRETRRWGGTCSVKLKTITPGSEGKGFSVNCIGLNNTSRNNIMTAIPNINKTVFQEVSTEFDITPKGQISLNNNQNAFLVIVGGRHNQYTSLQRPKCLVIQSPAGTVRTGIYSNMIRYSSTKVGSTFNYSLRENLCISY
jgi:prepilin-type N-terminal cleavage/methylation domain-containing protein